MALAAKEKKSLRYRAPAPVRFLFRVLEWGAPPLAVRLAAWKFCNPKRRRARPQERRILARAERRVFVNGSQELVVWTWGDGPFVMFHHGWSGSGAQMAPLADAVASAGFRVAVMDARAHGESPGRQATLPEMASDLAFVASELGPVHAFVGHSMGALMCARVMQQGVPATRMVMISAPSEIMPYLRFFQRVMGISDRTVDAMVELFRARLGHSPEEASAPLLGAGRTEPLLILHDREDPDVPMRHPEAWLASWPGARLELTEGLGHRRILRDAGIAGRVVRELGGG